MFGTISSDIDYDHNYHLILSGEKCYRKNAEHLQQYLHPWKPNQTQSGTEKKDPLPLKREASKEEEERPFKKSKSIELFLINFNELQLVIFFNLKFNLKGEIVGQGAFGAVRKGKFRGSTLIFFSFTIQVAIKILLKGLNDKKTLDMFKSEADLLCKLRHPNIVQCIGMVCPDPNTKEDLSEWCMGRNFPENSPKIHGYFQEISMKIL
jgi:hypothetical protein